MYGNLDPIEYHAERVAIILVGLIASGKVRPLLFPSVRVLCELLCPICSSS